MRLRFVFLPCFCLIVALGHLSTAALAAAGAVQFHCAGCAQINARTNLVTLHKASTVPASAGIHHLVLSRISGMVARSLNLDTNAVALFESLASDVLEKESVGSFGGTGTNSTGFILAVRVDAARAQFWHDHLDKALGVPGEKFTAAEFEGWGWKQRGTNSLWIVPARGWLVVGRGDEFLPLQVEYLQQLKLQGRPVPELQHDWLEAEVDAARLGDLSPDWLRLFKPARVKINVVDDEDDLRIAARIVYAEAVPWNFAPWQLPKDLIGSPLISFTAGQDTAAFLNVSPAIFHLDGEPFTNQFCAWALDQLPFMTYMAWPKSDATNTLEKTGPGLPEDFNGELKDFNGTELRWLDDQDKLVLSNLRVIVPALQAVKSKAGEYLLFDLFPLPPMIKAPSADLWNQVEERTNLVYYDWEQTGQRLQQWQMLGRMLLSRSRRPTEYVMRARNVEGKWWTQLAPLLGNTVTEITRVAPNELSLVRTAPVGVTAIEIFLLSDWLSTAGAPTVSARPAAP